MRNCFLILCMSVVLSFSCCSSDRNSNYKLYYNRINSAEFKLFEGDTLQSIAEYENAIESIQRPFLKDLRKLIALKITSAGDDDADKTMRLAFKYGASKKYLCCDSTIRNKYQEKWVEYFPEYRKQRAKFLASIDTVYRKQIIELIHEDQKYRSFCKSDFEKIDSVRKANDYLVLSKLKNLIQEKGYFGYSVIGEDLLWGNNENNFSEVIFCHMEPDTNKVYFYNVLKQAVMEGELYPSKYANIVDYDCIKSGKFEQLYGTTVFNYEGLYAFPLINLEQVDSLRSEIGLNSWEEYLTMSGTKYNDTIRPWENM